MIAISKAFVNCFSRSSANAKGALRWKQEQMLLQRSTVRFAFPRETRFNICAIASNSLGDFEIPKLFKASMVCLYCSVSLRPSYFFAAFDTELLFFCGLILALEMGSVMCTDNSSYPKSMSLSSSASWGTSLFCSSLFCTLCQTSSAPNYLSASSENFLPSSHTPILLRMRGISPWLFRRFLSYSFIKSSKVCEGFFQLLQVMNRCAQNLFCCGRFAHTLLITGAYKLVWYCLSITMKQVPYERSKL